ncbi:bifunctional 2-polyprenyl-6-hydroxyphenol methylase/3-demethylubiquinol 3-O-methyltransferase UbiG [Magnetospirillum sp. UT-4]|uniref:class I SAM-dependent methyltransferase n=1 Tax=Magnetospirillum sp. UT-4 TaxID=2681467 RepID=UPI00137CDF2A|nr:class I SAM-dependent methyltransferase [Magnetospirillum sp. UT-4]CAA7620044.1 putative SAM-dependent methyltransferases [Magnetospirillum sp. UT-4]
MTDMFDAERAQAYDRRIRDAIPGYEALHQLACMVLAETSGGQGRVLVAGAGTGSECVALAQACPGLHVVGVDPAEDMLAHAERKVAEHGLVERVRLYPSQVSELPVFEPFDAATLLLVLHFLPDDGAKQALLEDVAKHLKPGAPLVLADLFGPGWDDPWQAELRTFWQHLQRAAGIAEDDIGKGLGHVDRDIHPVTEARLAELLAAAGFGPPRQFFRALCFGGWVARRA